jgi:hypothetical protein
MVSVILKKILSSRPITFYGSIKEGTTLPWIFFFFFFKKNVYYMLVQLCIMIRWQITFFFLLFMPIRLAQAISFQKKKRVNQFRAVIVSALV